MQKENVGRFSCILLGVKELTGQAKKEVDLQKKIQEIRRTNKWSKVDIIIGIAFIILGWTLYNLAIRHYFLGTVWIEYPYRHAGLVLIVSGISLIVIGIAGLSYSRLQTKKYREQLKE